MGAEAGVKHAQPRNLVLLSSGAATGANTGSTIFTSRASYFHRVEHYDYIMASAVSGLVLYCPGKQMPMNHVPKDFRYVLIPLASVHVLT